MDLFKAIEEGREITVILEKLPLTKISKKETDSLLLHLVKKCFEKERKIILLELVGYWDQNLRDFLSCQFTVFLSDLSDEIIKYFCRKLIFRPIDIIAEIESSEYSDYTVKIIGRWERLFGNNICTREKEIITNEVVLSECSFYKMPPWIKIVIDDIPLINVDFMKLHEDIRVYGPLNGVGHENRMFICNQYELDDDDLEIDDNLNNEVDWFTGECRICGKRIGERKWAVRLPLKFDVDEDGGWKGCYCSWDCVRGENGIKKLDVKHLINRFELELIANGIEM